MSSESDSNESVSVDAIFGPEQPQGPGPRPAVAHRATDDTPTPVSGPTPQDELLKDGTVPSHLASGRGLDDGLRTIVEWVAVVVVAISAALLIKEFAFQAFEIPSRSMEPTVVPGDRILVNKLSYTFGEIGRGDLVVFDRPEGTPGDTDQLIKRAIGLPGETVEVRERGQLWIWGPGETPADAVLLDEPYLAPGARIAVPNQATAPTLDIWSPNCQNQPREPGVCTLGDGTYLVLGDNRGSSVDSRSFGPIDDDAIVGRAILRIWPIDALGSL